MEKKAILEAVEEALSGKERKFTQSVDMIITLRRVDLKKDDIKINDSLVLPNGSGREADVVVVADGEASTQAKKLVEKVITGKTLSDYEDSREAKKLAESADFFAVQAPLMPKFAQVFGRALGRRGKMPLPKDVMPPDANPKVTVERLKKSVRVRMRGQPVVWATVGTEEMEPEKLSENVSFVYDFVKGKIPLDKIGKVYVKTTMGKAVKIR